MNLLSLVIISSIICLPIFFANLSFGITDYNIKLSDKDSVESKQGLEYILEIPVYTQEHHEVIKVPLSKLIFKVLPIVDKDGNIISLNISSKPEFSNFYQEVGNFGKSHKIAFVYPVFTQAAYGDHGFYDYYKKKCDSRCLTVPFPNDLHPSYSTGAGSSLTMNLLNYSFITDFDIDRNPSILKKYDKVILLHNEYVTRKEYHAIVTYPNVVYLYPNALYAQVKVNYDMNTITLIKGHGYPNSNIGNGFHWKFDNSKFEYDYQCNNWSFYKIQNGKMLNCYPAYNLLYDESLLREILENK
jgi:hypothetical protein